MRCRECNVDLGEEYTKCPLCGAAASDDEPVLTGVETAEYPEYDKQTLLSQKNRYKPNFPSKYVFSVACVVAIALSVAAICGVPYVWRIGVPSVLALCSVVYFFTGIMEKSRLLHSAGYLLGCIALTVVVLIASLISREGGASAIASLGISVVSFLSLYILKPKKMTEQLKALFVL